jgi:hypothetical protein
MTFRGVLKYINSIPFPFGMRHYFAFDTVTPDLKDGELDSAESWDALRVAHPHFSISENREEWLCVARGEVKKDGQDGGMVARAKEVSEIISRLGITSVFSAGSGGAGMEYNIKKNLPDVRVVCSEYSPVAVELLRNVFIEADGVVQFDMKMGDWKQVMADDPQKHLVLLYRVDIHFTDEELRKIFCDMHQAGVEHILIILCGVVTLRGVLNRLVRRLRWTLSGTHYSFAGHLRSEASFPPFWHDLYTSTPVTLIGLPGFLLTRK